MEEKVFYEKGSVKITDKRFMIGGITYVLSNITSVNKITNASSLPVGVILIIIGILLTIDDIKFLALWTILFFIPGVLLLFTKSKYSVNLATSSGAVMAYSSKDEVEVDTIIRELNNAFVSKTT